MPQLFGECIEFRYKSRERGGSETKKRLKARVCVRVFVVIGSLSCCCGKYDLEEPEVIYSDRNM